MNISGSLEFSGSLESSEVGSGVRVALPLFLTFICVIGFSGNLLLVAILIHDLRKGKCSEVNCLVVNVGATDLLLLLFCIPVRIATYAQQSWLFGGFVCRTTEWFLHSCLAVKSFTLAAIAQARYRHVVTPPKLLGFRRRRLVLELLCAWAVSLLLPLPHLLFTRLRRGRQGWTCGFHIPDYASNFMNVFSKVYPLLAYVLPMIFSFCCYLRALRRKEMRNRAPIPRALSRRVTSMLMSVSLAFDAMWLPEWIVWVWSRHSSYGLLQPPNALMILAQVVLFLNCTINPAVFVAVSEEFREGLKNVWTTCRQCGTTGPSRGENGPSTVQTLHSMSSHRASQDSKMKEDKILPDVEHFWQDRRNTTAGEETDPMPWEHQEQP
ncbi:hypothetical protein GDO81_029810 [Engystomops pustulosus]|uniref:G-protein coupled receptors family 1 profile domain-containing protein n=1 Tax=Engystomops pustulosus TaxID=76066 RepID=A0AAV6Z0T9_ENGPU|nr:hypothetical protein GDO81_029810 [Engystomops pustulosus]